MPLVERLGGLHVVVAIKKDGGLAGGFERFSDNQGMHFCWNDINFRQTGSVQAIGDPLSGAVDVWLVLALCADARNAEKILQLIEVGFATALDVIEKIHP